MLPDAQQEIERAIGEFDLRLAVGKRNRAAGLPEGKWADQQGHPGKHDPSACNGPFLRSLSSPATLTLTIKKTSIMKMLATLVSEDWAAINDFSAPFEIELGTIGATASEKWFTVFFKSGRDNTIERQEADVVLLETDIAGVQHNLILELTKPEAQQLRAKCEKINELRERLDQGQSVADFAQGEVAAYINANA